jgi:phosphatidylserine synthase
MPRSTKGLDKYTYCLLDNIIPFFCKNNIHPNNITIFNIINSIYLYYNLKYCDNKTIISIQIILYYILDCLDGEIARQCKKQSKLGGYLDSVSDILFFSIVSTYLICKYLFNNFNYFNYYYVSLTYIIISIISLYNIELDTHEFKSNLFNFSHNNLPILYLIIIYLINK